MINKVISVGVLAVFCLARRASCQPNAKNVAEYIYAAMATYGLPSWAFADHER